MPTTVAREQPQEWLGEIVHGGENRPGNLSTGGTSDEGKPPHALVAGFQMGGFIDPLWAMKSLKEREATRHDQQG